MDVSKVSFVDVKLSATRTGAKPMEKGRAYLDQFMIGSMYDAEKEISKAFSKKAGGLGYASQDMNKVDGGRFEEDEEPSPYDLELMETLVILKQSIASSAYGLALDIAVFGGTPESVGYERMMSEGMVAKLYADVLNEWCLLRGWGRQK